MSKQLTISATASVLAMALFAVSATGAEPEMPIGFTAGYTTGATTKAAAPALDRMFPATFVTR